MKGRVSGLRFREHEMEPNPRTGLATGARKIPLVHGLVASFSLQYTEKTPRPPPHGGVEEQTGLATTRRSG